MAVQDGARRDILKAEVGRPEEEQVRTVSSGRPGAAKTRANFCIYNAYEIIDKTYEGQSHAQPR